MPLAERSLIIEYKNGHPIELLHLTASLSALGDQFKRYVAKETGIPTEARLYVHEVRQGSTIAELVAMAQTAIDLYETLDELGGFAPYIYEQLQTILQLRPAAKEMDKPEVRNLANLVTPTAVDNKGTMNLIDNRGGNINMYTITPVEAAAIQHNAHHLLNSEFPEQQRFANEPMVLFQLRDAPPGKTGDFGIIDRFSSRHHKLFFGSDDLKDMILHDNPFEKVFWVDGVVKTAGGKVVAYELSHLREVTPRDD